MANTNTDHKISDEFRHAIENVEPYRVKAEPSGKDKLTPEEAHSLGPIVYIREVWNETLRRAAHKKVISGWPGHEYMSKDMVTVDIPQHILDSMTYLWLDWFKARKYLQDVDLHIHYIRVIGTAFFPNNSEMDHRLEVHDESKYSYEEIFGYVLKWTHNIEGPEWDTSLKHHYDHNDHHPQYFEDGNSMAPEEAFYESIADMLSWNFIKNRGSHSNEYNMRWLYEIQEQYLSRYVESERQKVRDTLKKWQDSDVRFDISREQ